MIYAAQHCPIKSDNGNVSGTEHVVTSYESRTVKQLLRIIYFQEVTVVTFVKWEDNWDQIKRHSLQISRTLGIRLNET